MDVVDAGETVRISGVAPHANLISYDVCFPSTTTAGVSSCYTSASVAAVEQAIRDGVDVLNHSIGSTSPHGSWSSIDAVAYRNARAAGIDVAQSAGNAGPNPATTGSPADLPWLTSVASVSREQDVETTLTGLTSAGATLPDLTGYAGTSFPAGLPGSHPVVLASAVGDNLCATTHPEWAGSIVVCDRGVTARVDKSLRVKESGGVGMVMVAASTPEQLLSDAHHVPAVHISRTDGIALKDWVTGNASPRASIAASVSTGRYQVASSSSRGENRFTSTIAPALAAPGVDVLAAYGKNNATEWAHLSGTSMAAPHVAGSFALLKALQPGWSPAESQSALMTTARQDVVEGATASNPFTRGSGRVDLERASRAGLLLDESDAAYRAADPALGGDARTLNLASMADNACVGACSWTRRFTGTDLGAGTWTVTTESDAPGLSLDAPGTLTVTEGGTTSLTVNASWDAVTPGTWLFGTLVLTPPAGSEAVTARLPIAVRPTSATIPAKVEQATGRAASGVKVPLRVAEPEAAAVAVAGLARGAGSAETIAQDPSPNSPYDTAVGRVTRTVTVPPGTARMVVELEGSTAPDLDLYVLIGTTLASSGQVCFSAAGNSAEKCSVAAPASGTWTVVVNNYQGSGAALDSFVLRTTLVSEDPGSLSVATTPGADSHGLDAVVTWDEPRMAPGETWYGSLALTAAGERRYVPIDVRRVGPDVSRTASATTAEIGDAVTHTVRVTPASDPAPVTYTVEETLPAGSELVGAAPAGTTLAGDTLVWRPTVPASSTTPLTLTYATRVTNAVVDAQVLTHTTSHRTSQPGSQAVTLSSSVTVSADALPTAAPLTSSGPGVRSVTVPLAPGESVALESAGLPVPSLTVSGGVYTAEAATGVLTFTPSSGFHGTAPAAGYRVVDAYGRFASSGFTPTVWAPAPTASDRTSTGPGQQTVTVAAEPWQTVTLVDGADAVQALRVSNGTYTVAGGTITFTPDLGFLGVAEPVTFRVFDPYGQSATGTWTPTVSEEPVPPSPTATPTVRPTATPTVRPTGTRPPAPRPLTGKLVVTKKKGVVRASQHRPKAKKPSRFSARCVPSTGAVTDCSVTLTTTVKGGTVKVGSGTVSGPRASGGTVVVTLTRRGRALAARPQGVRTKARTTLRTSTGGRAVSSTTFRLASRKHTLTRTVRFTPAGVKVSRNDARWLKRTGKQATGVSTVVCVGHSDAVSSQRENLVLGRARAVAVCSALDLPPGVKVVVKTRGERSPVASNRTERGRAKNRRVEITFVR